MEWIEITAKTVEDAKASALDKLGIDADEAEFVIVEEPRQGLFRQVRGTARVRARVAPRAPRAKVERRGRRPKAKNSGSNAPAAAEEGTDHTTTTTPARSSKHRSPSRPAHRRKSSKPGIASGQKAAGSDHEATTEEGTTMTMSLDEQIAAAETFLSGLLDAIGFTGTISTERTDDANAHVNIVGDDLGLLIGPRGHTMNALQDLTRIALQKQASGSWEGHVHVDVNGYRAKRRAALAQFVESVAADVRTSGTPKALEPMSSSDRKAVHDTVNGIDGVHTTSEGHEPKRWVMIVPGDA